MSTLQDTFAALRREYAGRKLVEEEAGADPIDLFGRWFDEATRAEIPLANAMFLSTATSSGEPEGRVVLLKDYDPAGFVFYTNYMSSKSRTLEGNPRASLCFFWEPLDRQVRIGGQVARVSADESDAYFATRPRPSQISALISEQSSVVPGRSWLESAYAQADDEHTGEVKRPESWGGYRVRPDHFEFWQGCADRLHDRLRYLRLESSWRRERLAP